MSLRHSGVVPNFTTKSLAWLRDANQRAAIMEHAGAFAYSVDSKDDVDALAKVLEESDVDSPRASVQFVMGAHPAENLAGVLEAAGEHHLRVTLLGYKTNGRGKDHGRKPYGDWIAEAQKAMKKHYLRLGIDTALAAEFNRELRDAGVPPQCYQTEEGRFSMYIDAVTGRVARSSYETNPPTILKKWDKRFSSDAMQKKFLGWQAEGTR